MPKIRAAATLAGKRPERWVELLRALEAGETDNWQPGLFTYIEKNHATIINFLQGHRSNGVVDAYFRSQQNLGAATTVHHNSSDNVAKASGEQSWDGIRQNSVLFREIGPVHIKAYDEVNQIWIHELEPLWRRKYPFFDLDREADRRLIEIQGAVWNRHFNESLGALILHHVTCFDALIEKYEFKRRHPEKHAKLKSLDLPKALRLLLDERGHGAQCPDLLMCHPDDRSKWFFCDVKGPGDTLKENQIAFWSQLASVGGKPVYILKIEKAKTSIGLNCEIAPGLIVRNDELRKLEVQLASVI